MELKASGEAYIRRPNRGLNKRRGHKGRDKNREQYSDLLKACWMSHEKTQTLLKYWEEISSKALTYLGDDYGNYMKSIEVLKVGGAPLRLDGYVFRSQVVRELADILSKLKEKDVLVVSGMIACGKSVLLQQALMVSFSQEDDLGFKKVIFLPASGCDKDTNTVTLAAQQLLFDYLNTEDKTNLDLQSLPNDVERAKRVLIKKVLSLDLKVLLILQGVSDKSIIEALDVGYPMVVTSRRSNVFDTPHKYRVPEGISFNEAQELFLRIFSDPFDMMHLHKLWRTIRGHPLALTVVAHYLRDLKDQVPFQGDIWKNVYSHFPNCLEWSSEKNFCQMLDIYAKSLKDTMQKHFWKMAIFKQDAFISIYALQLLWEVSEAEAYSVSLTLTHHSMLLKKLNPSTNKYDFGIHNIYREYLLKTLDPPSIKAYHKILIDGCNLMNKETLNSCTDDYLLKNYGYHLEKAGYFERFPKLYFDVHYLTKKIKVVGPLDVIIDFKLYSNHITRGRQREMMLAEKLVHLIETYGKYIQQYKGVNLASLIIQTSQLGSSLYNLAFKPAPHNPQSCLQIRPVIRTQQEVVRSAIQRGFMKTQSDSVASLCFSVLNFLVIGCEDGTIEVWKIPFDHLLFKFKGHTKKISRLVIHKDRPLDLLSSSHDFTCKVWSLEHSPSGHHPESNQFHHLKDHHFPTLLQQCETSFAITWAEFSNKFKGRVYFLTDHGLEAWELNRKVSTINVKAMKTFTISEDDEYFIFGNIEEIAFYHRGEEVWTSRMMVINLISVGSDFIVVSNNGVKCYYSQSSRSEESHFESSLDPITDLIGGHSTNPKKGSKFAVLSNQNHLSVMRCDTGAISFQYDLCKLKNIYSRKSRLDVIFGFLESDRNYVVAFCEDSNISYLIIDKDLPQECIYTSLVWPPTQEKPRFSICSPTHNVTLHGDKPVNFPVNRIVKGFVLNNEGTALGYVGEKCVVVCKETGEHFEVPVHTRSPFENIFWVSSYLVVSFESCIQVISLEYPLSDWSIPNTIKTMAVIMGKDVFKGDTSTPMYIPKMIAHNTDTRVFLTLDTLVFTSLTDLHVNKGDSLLSTNIESGATQVMLSENGSWIAVGYPKQVVVYKRGEDTLEKELSQDMLSHIQTICISNNGTVCCCDENGVIGVFAPKRDALYYVFSRSVDVVSSPSDPSQFAVLDGYGNLSILCPEPMRRPALHAEVKKRCLKYAKRFLCGKKTSR